MFIEIRAQLVIIHPLQHGASLSHIQLGLYSQCNYNSKKISTSYCFNHCLTASVTFGHFIYTYYFIFLFVFILKVNNSLELI